ncbi:MAG: hypothetical protein AAGF44_05085, partial [Pseudomonadota bacterium]
MTLPSFADPWFLSLLPVPLLALRLRRRLTAGGAALAVPEGIGQALSLDLGIVGAGGRHLLLPI